MREAYTEAKLTSYEDLVAVVRGFMKSEQVRTVTVRGKIDTGASRLVIPEDIYKQLGLREIEKKVVEYADGREDELVVTSAVEVIINGRKEIVQPAVGRGKKVLIGNPVIEAMDYYFDSVTGELLPRHPEGPLEIIE